MDSATLLYIFGRPGQTPCKPSRSHLWALSGWSVAAALRVSPGNVLEPSALIKLGSVSGQDCVPLHTTVDVAGKEFVIASDDLAFGGKCQECPMFSRGGVLPTTNALPSAMTGVNTSWDCWGICWRVWWGRIPDASTLLFWAIEQAAELDLSQL